MSLFHYPELGHVLLEDMSRELIVCVVWIDHCSAILMATHSSVLAWRIPEMGEPGGLPSTGSHRVRHD